MKKAYLIACSLILGSMIFGSAYAGESIIDASLDPEQVMKTLPTLDCSKQADECRYIAAVEAAAYFDTCVSELDRRFGRENVDHSHDPEIRGWLPTWKPLSPASVKAAVLDPNNRFRLYLAVQVALYLRKIRSDDVGIECSRPGGVMANQPAEEMSGLLRRTRNWNVNGRANAQPR